MRPTNVAPARFAVHLCPFVRSLPDVRVPQLPLVPAATLTAIRHVTPARQFPLSGTHKPDQTRAFS
eukprot:12631-Rhodomonas_salina.3